MTTFGISSSCYSGSSSRPFQGGIQGSGSAGANWMLIAIFLVRYLYSKKMVPVSTTSISQTCYQISSLLYVDDVDLPLHNKGNESEEDIVSRAQSTLTTWHQGLRYTGGDLKLKKCSWTLQKYAWDNGRCLLKNSHHHKLKVKQQLAPKLLSAFHLLHLGL